MCWEGAMGYRWLVKQNLGREVLPWDRKDYFYYYYFFTYLLAVLGLAAARGLCLVVVSRS